MIPTVHYCNVTLWLR